MRRLKGIACAAGLVVILQTGCASLDLAGFLALNSDANGHERVVAGSVEVVAQSTQNTLSQMGFTTSMNREGDTIRITSRTAAGKNFTVVLVRSTNQGVDQTRVRIEWDGQGDTQASLQLLTQIETATRR
jgi:hypothetical protein